MGRGFTYNCKECGYEENVLLGVGMFFPKLCEDMLISIKDGKYGDEWKEAASSNKYAFVNGEVRFYLCPICGHWDNLDDITLYAPNEEGTVRMPYATTHDLQEDFYIVKKYEPLCKNCNNILLAIDESELLEKGSEVGLKCPKCATINQFGALHICWD